MTNLERQLAAQNVEKAEAALCDVLWEYRTYDSKLKVVVTYDDSQYELRYESCGKRISVTHVWWDDGEEVREPIDLGSGLRDVILCYFAREYECPLGFINPGKRT